MDQRSLMMWWMQKRMLSLTSWMTGTRSLGIVGEIEDGVRAAASTSFALAIRARWHRVGAGPGLQLKWYGWSE